MCGRVIRIEGISEKLQDKRANHMQEVGECLLGPEGLGGLDRTGVLGAKCTRRAPCRP